MWREEVARYFWLSNHHYLDDEIPKSEMISPDLHMSVIHNAGC